MTSERWHQVDAILDQVLEIPPAERAGFLAEACAEDEELRADVKAVLRAQEQPGGILNEPALNILAREIAKGLPPPSALTGTTVSHYRIVGIFGSGGMGVVYKAEDVRLRRFVALKFLSEEYATDREAMERFQQEARVVAALDHPNICTIYDIGEHEGRCFIVMQSLEGQTLSDRIARKPLSIEEVTEFGIELAGALDQAHRTGIIHRDLKPGNICITKDGRAKVLDFGVAKLSITTGPGSESVARDNRDQLTNPGAAIGTVAYMSPEQSLGRKLDHRSDLFSLGAVLYEMATGRRAFAGTTSALVFDSILNGMPVSAVRLNPDVPPALEAIITRSLAKDREARYQSAADLLADLKQLKKDIESADHSVSGIHARTSSLQAVRAITTGIVITGALLLARAWTPNENPAITSNEICTIPSFGGDLVPSDEVAVARSDQDGLWRVWIAPVNGGVPRPLTSGTLPELYPRFTPDGESMIYSTWTSKPDRIWKIPRAGGAAVPVTPARDEDDGMGEISPDGRWLAFARTEGDVTRIYIAPLRGGPARLLTRSPSTIPRWSPDGRWIAFSPDRSYTGGVFVIATDGSGERRLTKTGGWPAWWADGKRIGYLAVRPDGNQEIQIVSLDGGPPVAFPHAKFEGTNYPFDVSSKGQLVTTNSVHLSTEIWLIEPQR